jgi:hypothetical protein
MIQASPCGKSVFSRRAGMKWSGMVMPFQSGEREYENTRREKRLLCQLSAVVETVGRTGLMRDDEAACVSISRKGACVVSRLGVKVGDKLALALPAIDPDRRELMIVAWVREIDGERHIGLGPIDEDTYVIFSDSVIL